jgi:glucuronoarabinoxylan endo-1,4-beta-xylanase
MLCRCLVGVEQDGHTPVPVAFALDQNYPNPFNPLTTIFYTFPHQAFVSLRVFTLLGQEVPTLVSRLESAGNHTAVFDGTVVSSGVYVYRLQAETFMAQRKMMLVR